jgi:transposase
MTVYVLKAQLKELWYASDETGVRRRWQEWYRLAQESGLEPLKRFANRLKGHVEGIVDSARHRLNTSVLGG